MDCRHARQISIIVLNLRGSPAEQDSASSVQHELLAYPAAAQEPNNSASLVQIKRLWNSTP
jgi:hypothetical protein